jgi:hypothetical protein
VNQRDQHARGARRRATRIHPPDRRPTRGAMIVLPTGAHEAARGAVASVDRRRAAVPCSSGSPSSRRSGVQGLAARGDRIDLVLGASMAIASISWCFIANRGWWLMAGCRKIELAGRRMTRTVRHRSWRMAHRLGTCARDADALVGGGFLEVQNSRADGSRVVSPGGRGPTDDERKAVETWRGRGRIGEHIE